MRAPGGSSQDLCTTAVKTSVPTVKVLAAA